MSFPVYFEIGPVTIHPHWVFETLAYTLAFAWYRRQRRHEGDVVDARTRRWVIVAAAIGGLIGSRLLASLENPAALAGVWTHPGSLVAGKTIVGGLIGGLIAVEWVKRRLGVVQATGDLLVVPLVIGLAVGRAGCFLTGLSDRTHGLATALPWGIDFGDSVPRHPTQLYEIAFLLLLLAGLAALKQHLLVSGDRFKLFMVAYLGFRLAADFIKPAAHVAGLSIIQWACLATLAFYAPHVPRLIGEVRGG
jgi:phosphatidylglycerol---prolipoprotein diacylglyceryl transferase